MIKTLGLISGVLLPLFDIPLIWRVVKRRSSEDISLIWVVGVWFCIVGMTPASLTSKEIVWLVYGIVNFIFFTAVLVAVLWYHPSLHKR